MVTEKKQAKKNIKTKKVDEVLPLQNTEIPPARHPDETVNSQKPEQKTATKVVKKKQAKTGVEIRAIEKSKLKKSSNKIVEVDGDATQRTPILKRISFYLKYHTTVGENIFVTGNHAIVGNNISDQAFPLQYVNEDYWMGTIDILVGERIQLFEYRYFVKDFNGNINSELESDKVFDSSLYNAEEVRLIDSWSYSG